MTCQAPLSQPLRSLQSGHWFKLICGASFQHLPAIRNLTLAYTLAGADCIDVAADPAVIYAASQGIAAAVALASKAAVEKSEHSVPSPWLMVSLNDGEDPHFRKAELVPDCCPSDCSQPCVTICPAGAIDFTNPLEPAGVTAERCYGCGRCLPVCPIEQITTRSHVVRPEIVGPWLAEGTIDALEIHTQIGHFDAFEKLWGAIAPFVPHLKLLAISCPDGKGLIEYLQRLYGAIAPLPCPLIWQADGRSMSGDIGRGTTRATVKLGEKLLQAHLPGYVQLAGGTNQQTVAKLKAKKLLHPALMSNNAHPRDLTLHRHIAGIAYGSFARKLLAPIHAELESQPRESYDLEAYPSLYTQAIFSASTLVSQLKPHLNPQAICPAISANCEHGRDSPK